MEKYNPKKIEEKWQKKWKEEPELSQAQEDLNKKKFYCLDMFPYPSGDGLHVGHVENYTATDIYSRFKRMNGFNVLHPIGWDSFGLPAENFAIKTGVHPDKKTHDNIKNFTKQIRNLGFSYDWSREVDTSSREYYKWTQWFFLILYKNGLAYKKKAKVNWCDQCKTVLANEQAEGGVCERCKSKVIQKDLEQWFFKITDFIEDQSIEGKEIPGLINGLDKLDWPESTKSVQKNWIGKSEGAEFEMRIKNSEEKIDVYTTRVDTVFGMTYAVVAPEHPIIEILKDRIENYSEADGYIKKSKEKTDLERTELQKEKTGVELKGIKIINPFTEEEISLFVGDYVLGGYGTGAVMAVPAHDERDWDFAKKYNIPIVEVIKNKNGDSNISEAAFTDDGILINSKEYNDLTSSEAREKMTKWLEEKGIGKKKINYKLRDWLVSRQRYWGAPIPIIYCDKCGEVSVPEKDLPVELPTDVDFRPTGESPLALSNSFHDVKCPICGEKARRESDTMDTFVCSSWYYFRYADPKNKNEFASREALKKWLPVDFYMGGKEHTVLHLLYSRFFTKVLYKYGYIDFDEPFQKLRHQGIILGEDSFKMSKSRGNVINPDDIVKEFGADALRLYEMFMGPLEDMKAWNTNSIIGLRRFLDKVWTFIELFKKEGDEYFNEWIKPYEKGNKYVSNEKEYGLLADTSPKIKILLHKTIKKVTEDVEDLRFNTAISQLMIFLNSFYKKYDYDYKRGGAQTTMAMDGFLRGNDFEKFLILLAPFAPHLTEELWEKLGHNESIFKEKWPEYDESLIRDEEVELVIQINGKLRDRIKVPVDISEEEAIQKSKESEKIKQFIEGKEIRKIIFIKGKLINIVI